jgi:hypothetical protein
VLPEFHDGRDRFDIPGQITGALGFGALVFALIEGPSSRWTSAEVLGAAAVALLVLVAFVVIEATRAAPMLDLSFFRNRIIGGGRRCGPHRGPRCDPHQPRRPAPRVSQRRRLLALAALAAGILLRVGAKNREINRNR